MSDENTKNTLLDLFNCPDKRAVQKFCRDAVVTIEEFASVTTAASAGLLGSYLYGRHFVELVPEHLKPTADDIGVLGTPEGAKTMRKVSQIFKDRRKFGVHVFLPAVQGALALALLQPARHERRSLEGGTAHPLFPRELHE